MHAGGGRETGNLFGVALPASMLGSQKSRGGFLKPLEIPAPPYTPQDSVPLLFLLYINDIGTVLISDYTMIAPIRVASAMQ